jgi:hypothetical protein
VNRTNGLKHGLELPVNRQLFRTAPQLPEEDAIVIDAR